MVSNKIVRSSNCVAGTVNLPGDKSVAHRAALFSAIGHGTSVVANFPDSADPHSTLKVLRELGVKMETTDEGIVIEGKGVEGLQKPSEPLDCGNSGTTMRLLAGILATCPFESVLIGDESLSSRPMERIAGPLREMGAVVDLYQGRPPVKIHGPVTKAISYSLPIASAQVKSCVLLAGLGLDDETVVVERTPTRDHTERMLGLPSIASQGTWSITVSRANVPTGRLWVVPRDFSAAAYFIAAGLGLPDSKLVLEGVGINPSRTGFLNLVKAMGASLTIVSERSFSGEPIADIGVESSDLGGIQVPPELVPNVIDELPILAVLATRANGVTRVTGAEELRHKESDRIHAVVSNLTALGAQIAEHPDGFEVHGPCKMTGTTVQSFGDHRIAMAMGIAAMFAEGETEIVDAGCAEVSFPSFWHQLESINVL